MSQIQNCMRNKDCRPHEFQDQTYGKNKRVCNTAGKDKKDKLRCTVCGQILVSPQIKLEKSKK